MIRMVDTTGMVGIADMVGLAGSQASLADRVDMGLLDLAHLG
jgi:hypothetical protein